MNFNNPQATNYQSYLLRLWRDGPQEPWRATLHASTTGALHHFAEMEHLYAFLQARTRTSEEGSAGDELGDVGEVQE